MDFDAPNPTDAHRRERRSAAVMAVAFAAVAALAAADLASDVAEGTTVRHVIIEGLVVGFGLVGFAVVARRLAALARSKRQLEAEAEELAARLADTRRDAQRWRGEARELLRGLGAAIDDQLTRWQLSPAEKEVALLLLKGLSHKEIADARGVSAATVRQQAHDLYRKAGLSGRNDLAAFFLEDLLLPRG